MRRTDLFALALALVMPGPLAAADNPGPLAPGKPSGVREAQDNHQMEYILVGVSAVVASGLAVLLIKKKTVTSAASATSP
jgi:hypothetical protein